MNQREYVVAICLIVYLLIPFYIVAVSVLVGDQRLAKKCIFWGAGLASVTAALFFYQMMNIEVIYGKDLLDAWHQAQP